MYCSAFSQRLYLCTDVCIFTRENIVCTIRKHVFMEMRKQWPRSACMFMQSDQGLNCLLTESLDIDTTEYMNM